jgi:hypothetical protein
MKIEEMLLSESVQPGCHRSDLRGVEVETLRTRRDKQRLLPSLTCNVYTKNCYFQSRRGSVVRRVLRYCCATVFLERGPGPHPQFGLVRLKL